MFCINTHTSQFKALAENYDISTSTLESIVYQYYDETGSQEVFPSDTYIKAHLGAFPYKEDSYTAASTHKLWEKKYSKPLVYTSIPDLQIAKDMAELFFPKEAIISFKNSKGENIIVVREPKDKIEPLHRKDFENWQNYNDYLLYMGDLIPESEREKESEGKSPQTYTFKDGTTILVPFKPNEQQAEALNVINDFLDSDKTSMTLAGYAGTGKTSLMEIIAAKARKEGRKIVFSASTNKAAQVLGSRVKKAGFTSATLNKIFGISIEGDYSKPYDANNVRTLLREAKVENGSVVVIDEASMINEENYRLINTIAKENNLKIIFIGDKGQLPPVKESSISKVFRDNSLQVATLTQVERTGDNAILKEATDIRNGKPLSGESSFNKEGKGVAYIKPSNKQSINDIINRFTPRLQQNPDFFRILAHTNAKVEEYNNIVRNALGYHDYIPRVGEPIVGYTNWGSTYNKRTKQTEYKFINSASYRILEVKPSVNKSYNESAQFKVIPIVIMDVDGNTQKINFIDIKGNESNRQAALELAKKKVLLAQLANRAYRSGDKRGYAEFKKSINAIEDFLFVNDDIAIGNNVLHKKTFDFGYAMTIHKSQGSTFTHVLIDDTDIVAHTREKSLGTPIQGVYEGEELHTTSGGNLFTGVSKPENLNAHTINEAENNVPNQRQHLEYVAVSRATDTATIISNNVKSEDSPLNHWKEDGQNNTTSVVATQNIAPQEFYTKQNVDEYVQDLKADGIPSETIHVEHVPATETEDDYWVVTVGEKASEETRTAQEIMQQTMERLNTIKGIHVMKRADMQKFLQEHPEALNQVQPMMIGEKGAKSLDIAEEATIRMDNLSVANEMEKAGKDALTIKRATGWERGADGKWKYEVEDVQLIDKIVKQLSDKTILDYHYHDYQEDIYYTKERFNQMMNEGFEFDPWVKKEYIPKIFKVTDIIKQDKAFDNLVKSYPKLKNLTIIIDSYKGPGISNYQNGGSYNKSTNTLTVNLATPKEFVSVLNHELQHVIQDVEGFAYGANLGQFENHPEVVKQKKIVDNAFKKLIKASEDREAGRISVDDYFRFYNAQRKEDEKLHNLPYELYRRVAGETEARTVEKRLGLSVEERRNSIFTDDMYKDVAKEDLIFLQEHLDNSIAESRKHSPRHTKNDTSALHLSRLYNEVSNDIFKIPSEKRYKREIQSFIKKLPINTDRTQGIWYLSKDGKRAFRINTSIKNFEENKKETSYGFEVVDWYKLEKLSIEHIKEIRNGIIDRKNIDSIISRIESARGTFNSDNSIVKNKETTTDNAGLDLQALQGKSNRGQTLRDSRSNQGASIIEVGDTVFFLTPQGEVYGFVDKDGNIYLDETVITPEHPIHEYTHLWDRAVEKLNPKFWKTGVNIFKKTFLWNEILNDENYGKRWQATEDMTPERLENLIASEVHARLTGERGKELLEQIAKDKGSKGIIGKLKQWLLDFWKTIKGAFTPWTDDQLKRLNDLAGKDLDKALKYLSDMTLKDFTEGVNPMTQQPVQQDITKDNAALIQFKKDVNLLAGYYEGGGRHLRDDLPAITDDLNTKLANHFLGGEELSTEDYRKLWKLLEFYNTENGERAFRPKQQIAQQPQQQQIQGENIASKNLKNTEKIGHYNINYSDGLVQDEYSQNKKYSISDLPRIKRLKSLLEKAGEQGGEHRIKYRQFKQIDDVISKAVSEEGDYREKATSSLIYKLFGDNLTGIFEYDKESKELIINNWVNEFLEVAQESPREVASLIDFVTDKYDKDSVSLEIFINDLSDVISGLNLLNQNLGTINPDNNRSINEEEQGIPHSNKALQDISEQKNITADLKNELGGGKEATTEIKDAVKVAVQGITFEQALAGQETFFTPEEQAKVKQSLNGKNLQVMSISRVTDPAFFSKEIVSFLEQNAKKDLSDPTRVQAIEVWSKHDGLPIKDILDACKKYRVAPMVSFSITGLGGTALEEGVMKYQDMLQRVGKLIENGTLNPTSTTIRIDPILPGVTNMEDIRKIVETAKSFGIKKFVTSLVQSYGYTEGTPHDRKVISGINNALASEGKTYDWDKYYGRDVRGKINFKPKQEVIDEIGKVLLELDKDPEITIQTCAFAIKGLKVSACLDPLIIERVVGVDVTRPDGTYKRDTSRPECMCYGCHGDFFKGKNKKCFSSCAYCYAAHSGDNKLNYYNEDGTLKDTDYTRTERTQSSQQSPTPTSSILSSSDSQPSSTSHPVQMTNLAQVTGERLIQTDKAWKEKSLQYLDRDLGQAIEQGNETWKQSILNQIEEVKHAVDRISLPNYEYMNDLSEPIMVDAEWKIGTLKDLDNQITRLLQQSDYKSGDEASLLQEMDKVLQASSQEEYEENISPEQEKVNEKMKEYIRRNKILNKLIDNEVGLTQTEIRETAETVMNMVSDIITEIQQHPEKAKEYFPTLNTETDLSKASRKEIADTIGINRLLLLAKTKFDDFLQSEDPEIFPIYDEGKMVDQNLLVQECWEAIVRFGKNELIANEGFGFKLNKETHNYETSEEKYAGYEYDNYSSPQDEETELEEKDPQEHWLIESKTVSVIQSMSELVRMAYHECYVLDKDGNKVRDRWGIPKRVNKHEAVKRTLFWIKGTNSLEEMVKRLKAKETQNPWLSQLISKLTDTSGKYADLQSQFYSVMHRHYQLYSIGQDTNGKYVYKVLNRQIALSDILKGINVQFQMKKHPLFNKDNSINKENYTQLNKWVKELHDITKSYDIRKTAGKIQRAWVTRLKEFTEEDLQKIAACISASSKMLGFNISEEDVLPLINDEFLFTVSRELDSIIEGGGDGKGLKYHEEKGTKGEDFNPFEYGNEEGSVGGFLRNFLEPLVQNMEETALSTIYEDGKMYQSYTIPSFLSQLFDHFAQDREDFQKWVEGFYGNSQWFKKNGEWRTPWLKTMVEDGQDKARFVFEHHVQLNFNKHNYMRTLSPEEYTLSCISAYFINKTDWKNSENTPALFRVPLQSNKASNEFIRFYSDRSSKYKEHIIRDMMAFFWQELDRIDTVRKRNKKEGDIGYIETWDKQGRYFHIMPWLNAYLIDKGSKVSKDGNNLLKDSEGTVDTDRNSKLEHLLNKKLDALEKMSDKEEMELINLVKEAAYNALEEKFQKQLKEWEENGIIQAAQKIENIKDYTRDVKASLENFLWNDFFAANNILQLTITDKAFYNGTADLTKRLAELHSPGIKANTMATDYKGKQVSDGVYRTVILQDYKGFISNVIENISEIFDRLIEQASKEDEKGLIALKEDLVGKNGRFRKINVTDAQAYSSPSSYRKKAIMFGKWSQEAEEIYQKLRKGDFTISDLKVAFQPLKPFVYGHTHKDMGVGNTPISQMNVPFQAKNAEYLLIMAGAMMEGKETGRPNLLKAIYVIMKESEILFPGRGIDTIQFESAIKSGGQGIISLGQFMMSPKGENEAYAEMKSKIYGDEANSDGTTYNYNSFVHATSYDNYALQQEVPAHLKSHSQVEASQKRANISGDLDFYLNPNADHNDPANINYYTWKDHDGTEHKLTATEFRKEWERVHSENIEEKLQELEEIFDIKSLDRKARNIALSELLQEEIENSTRYSVDLMLACQINDEGEFRIPKGDPIQSKRIEQLINSIIKNRANKIKIKGGPVVQVSNWGLSKQLHIRFHDKKGGILLLKEEFDEAKKEGQFEEYKDYNEYKKENQAGIAKFEILVSATTKELFEKFKNPDGSINIEAIRRVDPELLKAITSRIPNEEKYSIAHCEIVGFLPEYAGEAVMFPYELTEIDDSDFDVDKRYFELKSIKIINDWKKVKDGMIRRLQEEYEEEHGKKPNFEARTKIKNRVDMFLDRIDYMRRMDEEGEANYQLYQRVLKEDFPYKTEYPEPGTAEARNNQIIDMAWAVMSNEKTASKILNPGGFDTQKKDAYVIAAYKATEGTIEMADLEKKDIKELQKLVNTTSDIAEFGTQVQFYSQNMAGSNLIGVYASNKVAHAILEADDINIDIEEVCESNFHLGGNIEDGNIEGGVEFSGRMKVDPTLDTQGNLVSKTGGSMIGASADTAKDPWLALLNVNMQTASVHSTLIRMGVPNKLISIFMAQEALSNVMKKYNIANLTEQTYLSNIVSSRIQELEKLYGFQNDSQITQEPLTDKELEQGLLKNTPMEERDKIEYKVLRIFSMLQSIADIVKNPTLVTRLNSISSAVGPLIIDNLILYHKLMKFKLSGEEGESTGLYTTDGRPIDIDTILEWHPILKSFSKPINLDNPSCITTKLFGDMPAGSTAFRYFLEALPENIKDRIYNRQLLSKLSDFYQSYMLVAGGLINPSHLKSFIPHTVVKDNKAVTIQSFIDYFLGIGEDRKGNKRKSIKEQYPNNAFIQAIQTEYDNKTHKAFLTINTTGMLEQEKNNLGTAWADLHKENPKLSTYLFEYAFFRGGIGFSPKTWMGLTPIYVKEHLINNDNNASYVNIYRHFPTSNMVNEIILDQFIRNNWNDSRLVPLKGGEGTKYTVDLKKGLLIVWDKNDIKDIIGTLFIKTKEGNNTYLWKRVQENKESKGSVTFKRVMPLGNNGEYLEMSMTDISPLETVVEEVKQDRQQDVSEDDQKDNNMLQEGSETKLEKNEAAQIQTLKDLVPLVTDMKKISGNIAESYVFGLRERIIKNNVPNWMKKDLKAMAEKTGLSLNLEEALEWFKKLC